MNDSSRQTENKTALELVERYLQSVRFWLPKTRNQQGLIAELGEDLRSQIDDKQTQLGRPLDVSDVSEILKRCGHPMIVAGRLGPKRYVIGPTLYPVYAFVLKMSLLWIVVPVIIFIVGPVNLARLGNWGAAVANTMGNLWSAAFITAGVITLVFAILERTHAIAGAQCKWDPRTLPPLQESERKTSLLHPVCEVVFGWIGLIWLLLLPHYPVLILGPGAAFLKAGPVWHSVYVPIVLVAVFALLRPGITLARPQWTWCPPVAQLVQTFLGWMVLKLILNTVLHPPAGNLQPLIVLSDAAGNSAQYIRVAAIVNISVLLSLIGTWIGLSIAVAIQTWEVMKYFRRRTTGQHQLTTLQAQ